MMKTFAIETYGCRMNICDSEIIIRILTENGFEYSDNVRSADIVILNSCSVKEDGHNKIYERLNYFNSEPSFCEKTIIIVGCFASLLTERIFELYPTIDLIVHPKCYKALPELLEKVRVGETHIISSDYNGNELYDGIFPLRKLENRTTVAVVIMKGCNQACSYCIEPITRGKEVCKNPESIVREINAAIEDGYKEINLIGHSIDKYESFSETIGKHINFALLLDMLAKMFPDVRIKFLSSHPLYLSDEILQVIAANPNIMRVVHFPIQSASDRMLKAMNRQYTMTYVRERLRKIHEIIPDMRIVTDIIVGFCGETESDFQETYDFLSNEFIFDDINVFKYSMRPGTAAHKLYIDDVPENVKEERYNAIIELRDYIKKVLNQSMVGKTVKIIVEKVSGPMEIEMNKWLTLHLYSIYGRDSYNNNVWYEERMNSQFSISEDSMINTIQEVKIYRASKKGLFGYEY